MAKEQNSNITPEIWRSLGLSDSEYRKIVNTLKREPTRTELAMFSVEWSEHCGYTRSKSWLKLFPKKGKFPILVGEDSGGIIVDGFALVFKMESHNHPSQVEPKQGAATGVGGIIRDIFTAGARPVALLNSLRFGSLDIGYNRYLTKGVVDGIQYYGNCIGVPTVGGEIYFEDCYTGNCLVNVMSLGVAKKEELARAQAKGAGNLIMYVGASTGRDGIGGCSILASKELGKGEEKRPTVQIGDPFLEKCLIEATLEALATGHITGIKDMGAAGLTCSVSEMASAGNVGIEIDLENVPCREKGMQPWEIMMSESQERMLACVKKGREEQIKKIFEKWELNAVVIGEVTEDKIVRVKNKEEKIVEVAAGHLTGAPTYKMPFEKPEYINKANKLDLANIEEPKDYNQVLLKLIGCPTIASKNWVYEQYDHMVQLNTLVVPGADAAVIRLKGTKKGVALTTDCNSRYCYLSPFKGAQIAVAEAARNLVCTGAIPAAITDCLNFGNPEKPDIYWQFKNCVEGIIDSCEKLKLPVVSGNVSFYNQNPDGAIYPTPTIGMIGIIEDIDSICTQNFKRNNEIIVLLGECTEEVGASQYLKEIHSLVKGQAPGINLEVEQALHETVLGIIKDNLASSAHDCSEGGLAVGLAESCISDKDNMIGAVIDNLQFAYRKDAVLFGEAQSRVIISCPKENISKIEKIASKHNISCESIGITGGNSLKISVNEDELINLKLDSLSSQWRDSLRRRFDSDS